MKKNIGKKLKDTKGITLVALIVTIIVLLILVAVSLSAVFSQDGIFSRTEQAVDKHGQAKARETLELALGEAQMQKYEEGLTEEQLDNKIATIEGELLPKEKPEYPNLQNVIVDGYIFEIDRSVPKIVDYKGPANGVIITAQIAQNGDWKNPSATVTGTMKKYGGGSIINTIVTATNGVTIPSNFPTTGGSYTIPNITTDTDITITTTDSEEKTVTKTIHVVLVRDITAPVISDATVILSEKTEILNGMKIKISAKARDTESGLKELRYSITPTTVIPAATGTLKSGQALELEATAIGEYTVTFVAEDNAGNITNPGTTMPKVKATDTMSVAEVKEKVNESNIREYMGTKVDYNPVAKGIWRIFYYDADGDFGAVRTIYLKRDFVSEDTKLKNYMSYNPKDGGAMMKRMNPLWRNTPANSSSIDLPNEHCVAWLCDPAQWTNYKTANSSFAIGSPSVEMYMKAFNVWKAGNKNANNLIYKIGNVNGYAVGANGEYANSGASTNNGTIETGPNNIFMTKGGFWWLASPSMAHDNSIFLIASDFNRVVCFNSNITYGVCPIVPLDL